MIALILGMIVGQNETVGLSPETIAAYRDALRDSDTSPAQPVVFADLWNRPDVYRGRRVRIEGTIVREFRAPASGELPARVEVWFEDASRNLACAVFPDGAPSRSFAGRVRATGTSLGQVRYQSSDSVRLAPLIVGSTPPLALGNPVPNFGSSWDATGWLVGLGGFAVVAIFMARAFARRPPGPREIAGPGVEFES